MSFARGACLRGMPHEQPWRQDIATLNGSDGHALMGSVTVLECPGDLCRDSTLKNTPVR
jgi:hypothetical protein